MRAERRLSRFQYLHLAPVVSVLEKAHPTSLRGGLRHLLEPLADIAEVDVDGEYPLVVSGCIARLLACFRCVTEQVQHADQILVFHPRLAQRSSKHSESGVVIVAIDE